MPEAMGLISRPQTSERDLRVQIRREVLARISTAIETARLATATIAAAMSAAIFLLGVPRTLARLAPAAIVSVALAAQHRQFALELLQDDFRRILLDAALIGPFPGLQRPFDVNLVALLTYCSTTFTI